MFTPVSMEKSGPAQFCPSPNTKYNWCWKIWGGEKTDRLGKKLTGYFFLPGKKLTSQFLPRGRNGPAWSFPGERLAGGKNWPLHRVHTPIRHQYVLHGHVLEATDHAKYLGLGISHDLNWNTHIQNLTTKANSTRTLGFVRRNIQT